MGKYFYKFYNKFISVVFVLLGFSACTKKSDRYEYGSPSASYARYIFYGELTNEHNIPMKTGIKITIENIHKQTFRDTVSIISASNGTFLLYKNGDPYLDSFKLTFTDAEPIEYYQSFDTVLGFKNPVLTNGDGKLCIGEIDKHIRVSLKNKYTIFKWEKR